MVPFTVDELFWILIGTCIACVISFGYLVYMAVYPK